MAARLTVPHAPGSLCMDASYAPSSSRRSPCSLSGRATARAARCSRLSAGSTALAGRVPGRALNGALSSPGQRELGAGWGRQVCRASAGNTGGPDAFDDFDLSAPFLYKPDDYNEVALHYVEVDPDEGTGTLLFTKTEEDLEEVTRCLTIKVGGDTMFAILTLLGHNAGIDRPMTIDLLWSVLQRGAQVDGKKFKLLFTAIVGTREQVFLGRLFFGDDETGEIKWDVDCRPSDACWLSFKQRCPMMVHTGVWDGLSITYEAAMLRMNGLRNNVEKRLASAQEEWEDTYGEDGEGEEDGDDAYTVVDYGEKKGKQQPRRRDLDLDFQVQMLERLFDQS